ncbi:MAG: 4Fe-4S binding protein [Bacteroidales bacterium]
MAFSFLKKIRVVVSLLFFLLISFLFIDFTNSLSPEVVNGTLYFQFIPSILKFINLLGIATTGFIVVLILTLLFGRVYCSTFCPLGTLQDITNHFGKKFRKRKIYKYARPYNWIRYSFLAITILFLIFGSIFFVNLLDPYSNFGKIVSNLIRPVYYGINNIIAAILQKFEIFALYKVDIKSYSWLSFGYSLFILTLVVRLAMKKGRLYCNTVCPVGTFLGLISKVSFFKIRLDHTLCNSCGTCGAMCKAQCIDTKERKVDFSRCVGCLNCLTVCPGNGVKFDWRKNPKESNEKPSHKNRREFIGKSPCYRWGPLPF